MKKDMSFKNNKNGKKASFVMFILLAFFILLPQHNAQAGLSVTIGDIPKTIRDFIIDIKDSIKEGADKYAKKALSTTLQNTLNRLAYDAANRIATSGEGQSPLWVVEDMGTYWKNIGDAAAGDFIDSLGKEWAVDLCQPPDPNIRLKIGLGLIEQQRPEAPDCSVSQLANNYSSAWDKYEAMANGNYLNSVATLFEPGGSEISAAFELFGRTTTAKLEAKDDAEKKSVISEGWLDVTNIAGKKEGIPGLEKTDLENANTSKWNQLLSTTGDAFIDASNVFLNQLALEGFQRGLRELAKNQGDTSLAYDYSKISFNGDSAAESLVKYGITQVKEKLSSIIKPNFSVNTDYNVLSDLAICPSNPGPNNCALDTDFSAAIAEKNTVGEALNNGYLHKDWFITNDSNNYQSYNLRAVSILRKFRIVPIAWEEAFSKVIDKNKKVTLNDLISCFSDNDSYTDFSVNFDTSDTNWCAGLVDPNWVLKAPSFQCVLEGPGSQILNKIIIDDYSSSQASKVINITRVDDYCADEQSCIDENSDGTCEKYGYCNEEKRLWKFSSDSCEPINNTCQAFTKKDDNTKISYLQNTLDYSSCNAENIGCQQYSYNGSYVNDAVNWEKRYSTYLNSQAQTCSAGDDSCTELFRALPGWNNTNFVMNSDFSYDMEWPVSFGSSSVVEISGKKVLSLSGSNVVKLESNNDFSLLPKNMTAIPGWSYSLSADIFIVQGNKVFMTLGSSISTSTSEIGSWQTISVSAVSNKTTLSDLNFFILGSGSNINFYLKNLRLTPNATPISGGTYGVYPLYQKLIPDYLESACYVKTNSGTNDYTLKDDAPSICNNYARKCNKDEVGCSFFTAVKDKFTVAAKVKDSDYCQAECSGYNSYLAKSSYFFGASFDNIIPENSKTCGAESVGCASFTNLNNINDGGEQTEYYTYVRQCIKPDALSCGNFLSWEGSNSDGYQLKNSSLKKANNGGIALVDESLRDICRDIYNLPVSDPRYNSDCREFYSRDGQVSYELLSNTISCSDSCTDYRLNDKNIDRTLSESECIGTDKSWDNNQAFCYVCKNGGKWDKKANSCVYKAIPEEAKSCSAAEVGCREYNGKDGNSLRLLTSYDFETNENIIGEAKISSESTFKNGHSLLFKGQVDLVAPVDLTRGNAYVIKFLAKSEPNAELKISFINSDNEESVFSADINKNTSLTLDSSEKWHIYEVNLSNLDHEIKDEKLRLFSQDYVYVDNIIVNEVGDRFYLIQNSSVIPDSCYYDIFGEYQGPNYNLGCNQYEDNLDNTYYIHDFSQLCQNSAAGCEQMVSTNNSKSLYSQNINLNSDNKKDACQINTPGCLSIPGHETIYAVYDPSKKCNATNKGCSRFGSLEDDGVNLVWSDVYKKDLPDNYDKILCQDQEIGCSQWTNDDNNSSVYFKDPKSDVCIYRAGGAGSNVATKSWYKAPQKKCDTNGNNLIELIERDSKICNSDGDCSGNNKCLIDNNDYFCPVSYLETFGYGGTGNGVPVPSESAAICDSNSSSCGEYIDPNSKYNPNLIFNPLLTINGAVTEGWSRVGNGIYYEQTVPVKQNSLYVFEVKNALKDAPSSLSSLRADINNNGNIIRTLTKENVLSSGEIGSTTISLVNGSVIFHSGLNNYLTISRSAGGKQLISLREIIIDYQLGSNLDTSSCNGVFNTDAGCILFNTRLQAGEKLQSLKYDAQGTSEGSVPATCTDGNCSANQLIKVTPDRKCSRWLACKTYIENPITKERTCYSMGECDRLGDDGECANYINTDDLVRKYNVNSNDKNATGYSLLNNYYLGGMKEVGMITGISFDFEGDTSPNCYDEIGLEKIDSCNVVKNSPSDTTIDYPAHGKAYVEVRGDNKVKISGQDGNKINTNTDYYINYLVNTSQSSAKAQVIIIDRKDNKVLQTFESTAAGWERKINKIRIENYPGNSVNIDIYLSSDSNIELPVYFDDINIEPVLQVADDKYVAPECRLYPDTSSLTCKSTENSNGITTVKSGLYGYCLQHDPKNNNACLMWYPVSDINSMDRTTGSGDNLLGYNGKFPLNYCTEADGNFQVLELVKAFWYYKNDTKDGSSPATFLKKRLGITTSLPDLNNGQSYIIYSQSISQDKIYCGSDNYIQVFTTQDLFNFNSDVGLDGYCLPRPNKVVIGSNSISTMAFGGASGVNYRPETGVIYGQNGTGSPYYHEAWVPFDGSFNKTATKGDDSKIDSEDKNTVASFNPTSSFVNGQFDSIMILPSGVTSISSNLKRLKSDNIFNIDCNRFAQVVDESGNNQAWSARVSNSDTYATATPLFFPSNSALFAYGRNNGDIPFGSAILDSNFNFLTSKKLSLKNIGDINNQEGSAKSFAGRPYGCQGSSCANIGQCSGDHNIFCIYYGNNDAATTTVNALGCGGDLGTCEQLWNGTINAETAQKNLSRIFLNRYSGYYYSSSENKYVVDTKTDLSQMTTESMGPCTNNTRPVNGFCWVKPTINNISLFDNLGQKISFNGDSFKVNKGGMYQLRFNSLVDLEQQPLKQIVVDWGDSTQIITGTDNKPDENSPHILYHYYTPGNKNKPTIKIIDNWDKYDCNKFNGDECSQ